MRAIRTLLIGAAAAAMAAAPSFTANAETYPVSGKWTYEIPPEDGPAKDCGKRFMEFNGEQRRDTGGGVPGYRNFSIDQTNGSEYRVVDSFSTGQINARSSYTLRKVDGDNIELRLDSGGKTIKLRRCS
jgi:hypothetical protein